MSVFDKHRDALEIHETMMGSPRGRLAVALDLLTDSLALVGQHGVYCRSERFPGKPKMDIALVLEQLEEPQAVDAERDGGAQGADLGLVGGSAPHPGWSLAGGPAPRAAPRTRAVRAHGRIGASSSARRGGSVGDVASQPADGRNHVLDESVDSRNPGRVAGSGRLRRQFDVPKRQRRLFRGVLRRLRWRLLPHRPGDLPHPDDRS